MKTLRTLLLSAVLAAIVSPALRAQGSDPLLTEVVDISDIYTTHFQFATDLIYANASNTENILSSIVKDNRNILAVIATAPFDETYSISAMESNGSLHTYILRYNREPSVLVIDEKNNRRDTSRDTIHLSMRYTTHLIYSREVAYADLSQIDKVIGRKVSEIPNTLALKAREPFSGTSSLTTKELDGDVNTYILDFQEAPAKLNYDFRNPVSVNPHGETDVTQTRNIQAPMLKEVLEYPQSIYHIATRRGRIRFVCENIVSHSDILFITLRIENHSGVSYEPDGVSFILQTWSHRKRSLENQSNIQPKNRYGSLTVAPGMTGRMTLSFSKLTLSQKQALEIILYEKNGNRSYKLLLSPDDINMAPAPDDLQKRM